MKIILEKNSSNKIEISALGKKRHICGGRRGHAGSRGMAHGAVGMSMILGKNSSNKFEISARGKKGIVGKERMVLWCGGSHAEVCG